MWKSSFEEIDAQADNGQKHAVKWRLEVICSKEGNILRYKENHGLGGGRWKTR
jgi:hypothetical protein